MPLARGFSRQHGITHFASIGSASGLKHKRRGFTYASPYTLARGLPSPRRATLLRHPIACLLPDRFTRSPETTPKGHPRIGRLASPDSAWARQSRYGNINPLSIDYACRPRLRSRLTQGGLAWPWNPWSFGGGVSHSSFATHACILTRVASTTGSPRRFTRHTTLPYPSTRLDRTPKDTAEQIRKCHSFGGSLEPRYIVGAESLDQ